MRGGEVQVAGSGGAEERHWVEEVVVVGGVGCLCRLLLKAWREFGEELAPRTLGTFPGRRST